MEENLRAFAVLLYRKGTCSRLQEGEIPKTVPVADSRKWARLRETRIYDTTKDVNYY